MVTGHILCPAAAPARRDGRHNIIMTPHPIVSELTTLLGKDAVLSGESEPDSDVAANCTDTDNGYLQ